MKKLITSTSLGIFAFFIVYLIGCFASVSFNINTWPEGIRYIVCWFGAIAFIASFIVSFNHNEVVKTHENEVKIDQLRIELKKLRDSNKKETI